MDINLAGLASQLTPTPIHPEWRHDPDRYYARVSLDLPTFGPALRLLARLTAALHATPVRAHRLAAA